MTRWMRAAAALPAMLAAGPIAAAASGAAMRAADDSRMERFAESGSKGADLRNCTADRSWCAELARDRPDGPWTLRIAARGPGRSVGERTHLFAVPAVYWGPDGDGGLGIWDTIVREGDGAALVGLELSHAKGARPGFFSWQRRLVLLRVPAEDRAIPVPVLEAPLSGNVEQPLCAAPTVRGYPPHGCGDLLRFSASLTLALPPSPGPPDLAMAVTASARHGLRPRADGLPRALEPMGDPDPACTYTRTYRFDAAGDRYLPDAPLPACGNYLEP